MPPPPTTTGRPSAGPLGTGEAPEGCQPPTEWSEAKNVKWKVEVPGNGASTPIIWGDRIYLTTAIQTEKKVGAAAGADSLAKAPFLAQNDGDAPAPLPDFLKRFDTDNDGQLNEAERSKMREEMRGRRGNRGGGNTGGNGGRPGGGFGIEKPAQVYQFALVCFDRETGKELWTKVAKEEVPHEGHHRDHGFASATPVTDGEHLYVSFGSRGIFCFDMDGEKKWEKDLGDMQTRNSFGEGTSPALHGDTLIIKWDHEGDSFIVALDAKTGEERWRKERDEQTSWATPLVIAGDKPYAIAAATNKVIAYDLATGDTVWETTGMTANVIPTPVRDSERVYVMSGFRGSALQAIELGNKGKLAAGNGIAWEHNEGTPYVPSPLLTGGNLYFYQGNNAILTCLDAKTGKPHFERERIGDIRGVYASPIAAGGHIYLLGREGNCAVIKAGNTLESVATNKLDENFDACPAVAGNALFLRGHKHLYCIAEG
ncbi:MAG: PQQ-binding-like beta-propeller repeat protein [Verrucomicrobiales bacterium]